MSTDVKRGSPMNPSAEGGATLTRPAPAVHATDGAGTVQPHHREEHRQVNWLRDVILGGQDGLIAGGGSTAVLLAAGFAAAITESISMGAVGYTSAVPPPESVRISARRRSLRGSWASASRVTSMCSAAVLNPALPRTGSATSPPPT